ncbi:META domain-containing protein [Cryobacterium sp. 10I5]|uniref:META domain-containing protein n=1 Tax=Cryobacterium sp. 10I5 TaxID=3048581 RepID=UPI002B22454A|nr:META domain-containing protein [Cryobacterium sp. 10I5]MEB0265810.1 META domain-containing protein [Cryobacterium sp. 10I5]
MVTLLARRILVATAAASVAVALSGCGASAESAATGVWGDPDAPRMPSLELHEDRSLSGTDGCNRLVGTWKMSGDRIEFGPIASTLMACEGVDTWLGAATTATIDGSTMTLTDQGGKEIGTLERRPASSPN